MIFNSVVFVLFYLIVTALYFILPYRFRWMLLLAASCYFYITFVPIYIVILGFTIVVDYYAGLFIEKATDPKKRKQLLLCSLVANIGVLFFFKYYNFLNSNISLLFNNFNAKNPLPCLTILLPIGLSFHTFQAMSYTIEVYRGNQKAEKHFGIYSLYVMFYPQLVAGPIERPQNILHQMHEEHPFDYGNMIEGLKQMLWGFFKKLVVADRLSIYVNSIFNNAEVHNGSSIAIACFFFAIQIYCDFSGYSDIAIGCAKTMGFDLMTNFRRPYFAKSINEFWSRWHISLSTWFRDYLYIPLGGNRVTKFKLYRNLFIVFFISGIWHGANYTFIIWGALHAVYTIVGQVITPYTKDIHLKLHINKRITDAVRMFIIIILVTFAWIFFRANSMDNAMTVIHNLRSFGKAPFLGDSISNFGHCLLAISLLLIIEYKKEYYPDKFNFFYHPNIAIRWGSIIIMLAAILLFGVFNGGQFIYFQF
ncbi:MBOAT family O-acyltransferase [Parasediminibacterium sp. JCM 36343]|uniref:MBOAT family O-acyltransferase n=1 Tax=Parasediminibacterium sp. JCM 36343 TaxID=3374279 RepID=UPI0039794CC9